MAVESDPASPIDPLRTPGLPPVEGARFVALCAHAARMLQLQATDLAARWGQQVPNVTVQESDAALAGQRPDVSALVAAIAASLTFDPGPADDVVMLGVAFGEKAFGTGTSLHHMLKGLDLLSAMMTYAVEADVACRPAKGVRLHEAIRLVRRLQQASSLLSLAASKGYTQALGTAMREHFRHLRHDLRNPLGTIRSTLALMDDETIPLVERSSPRFRAMAKRNARSLGDLIAARLSDAEAMGPIVPLQAVSLRSIACAVRRGLRGEASARVVTVSVAGTKVRARTDAAGLELLMHEVLLAALVEALEGDQLTIDFGEPAHDRVLVRLRVSSSRALITKAEALSRLNGLSERLGARVQVSRDATIFFPAQRIVLDTPARAGAPVSVEGTVNESGATGSGRGNAGNDVRGPREREHGQSSRL